MESLNVSPDLLRTQATHARTGSAAIGEAQSAIGSMNLTGGAFGIMCSFLVPPAMLVTGAASLMLANAKGMLDREATALDETASDFESTDSNRESAFNGADTGDNTSGAYR